MFVYKEVIIMKSIVREEGYPVDLLRTYLAMIEGSVNTSQFQRFYVAWPDGSVDVTDRGNFSCAVYVSSILTLVCLITGGVHTTVDETICDMLESGWHEVYYSSDTAHLLPMGCVILWGEASVCSDGRLHRHIGFYVGNGKAVSNHPVDRVPKRHHITFGEDENGSPVRPVLRVYQNPSLRRDVSVPGR
jgi:hypothetical protein